MNTQLWEIVISLRDLRSQGLTIPKNSKKSLWAWRFVNVDVKFDPDTLRPATEESVPRLKGAP